MNGNEFLKKLKRLAKAGNVELHVDAQRGKGSHAVVWLGARRTILKDRRKELGAGLLRAMLADLGIPPEDF